jgi:hypothetical protein
VSERLKWLRLNEDGYKPQPYEQLTIAYRRAGWNEATREAAIEKQRRRREGQSAIGKAWNILMDVGLGYGHKTWRALGWIALLVVLGSAIFSIAHPAHFTPAKAATEIPPFQPIVYTLDVMVPVINLNQRASWIAHSYAAWVSVAYTVVGWLLATLVVATLTGLNRKE